VVIGDVGLRSKADYDNDNEKTERESSFSGLTGESRRPPAAPQPNGLDARLRGHDVETIVVVVSGAPAERLSLS